MADLGLAVLARRRRRIHAQRGKGFLGIFYSSRGSKYRFPMTRKKMSRGSMSSTVVMTRRVGSSLKERLATAVSILSIDLEITSSPWREYRSPRASCVRGRVSRVTLNH